ncbi:hypothetical protein AKO1_002175 [Acrasis kona]|uniref:Uncharacterized protein n=1 Tax=Acrasis kona TaxID=1008807 RepID=A0AAW2Z7X3_9EUKA
MKQSVIVLVLFMFTLCFAQFLDTNQFGTAGFYVGIVQNQLLNHKPNKLRDHRGGLFKLSKVHGTHLGIHKEALNKFIINNNKIQSNL